MEYYNPKTKEFQLSEESDTDIIFKEMVKQFPDANITKYSSGLVGIDRVLTLAEKTAFKDKVKAI